VQGGINAALILQCRLYTLHALCKQASSHDHSRLETRQTDLPVLGLDIIWIKGSVTLRGGIVLFIMEMKLISYREVIGRSFGMNALRV
jgi:hypothetical protein